NIAPETFARLAEIKNIIGVKEASGSTEQTSDILRLTNGKFTVLSGDDALTVPLMAIGAKGVIATIGNAMPREIHELAAAGLAGDFERARQLHYKMRPRMPPCSHKPTPSATSRPPVFRGRSANNHPRPWAPMPPPAAEKLKAAMKELRLI